MLSERLMIWIYYLTIMSIILTIQRLSLTPDWHRRNWTFGDPPNLGFQGGLSEDKSRDQTGFDYTRSPPSRYTRNPRSRSRSPSSWWDRDRRRRTCIGAPQDDEKHLHRDVEIVLCMEIIATIAMEIEVISVVEAEIEIAIATLDSEAQTEKVPWQKPKPKPTITWPGVPIPGPRPIGGSATVVASELWRYKVL